MPFWKHRKCGKRMACCSALRRPCIASLPRYCMPPCPYCPRHPTYPAAPSSSNSDCSCSEETFCTVETCRNAPMCISTRPMYCPYGSYQRERTNPLLSSRTPHGNKPGLPLARGPSNDMDVTPNPFVFMPPPFPPDYGRIGGDFPWVHNPNIPPRVPSEVPPEAGSVATPEVPDTPADITDSSPEMSFRVCSRHNFPRTSSTYVPQFISSSPISRKAGRFDPQLSPLHRTPLDFPQSRPQMDYSYAPSAHLPTAEPAIGEREIVNQRNLTNCNQAQDCICKRDEAKALQKDELYRSLQCSKHNGSCDVEMPCSRNYETHFNSPQICDGASAGIRPIDTIQPASGLQNASHLRYHDRQTMEAPHTSHGSFPPHGSHVTNATDLYTPVEASALNGSNCPCRYPPSFKHLSCAGNISGSCSCDQT